MRKQLLSICLLAVSICFCAHAADSMDALQQRMRGRLPQLTALKQQKIVGETWDGLVAVVPGTAATAAAQGLVQAENADRRELYRLIAKRLGTSGEQVGRKRAERIRAKARPGLMLQAADGSWHEQK